jgi:hypothetical protein
LDPDIPRKEVLSGERSGEVRITSPLPLLERRGDYLSKSKLKNLERDDIVFRSEAVEKVIETALMICIKCS